MMIFVFVGGMVVGWVQMFLLLDWYTRSGQFYYSPPKRGIYSTQLTAEQMDHDIVTVPGEGN